MKVEEILNLSFKSVYKLIDQYSLTIDDLNKDTKVIKKKFNRLGINQYMMDCYSSDRYLRLIRYKTVKRSRTSTEFSNSDLQIHVSMDNTSDPLVHVIYNGKVYDSIVPWDSNLKEVLKKGKILDI